MVLIRSVFIEKFDFSLFEKYLQNPLFHCKDFQDKKKRKNTEELGYLLDGERFLPRSVDQEVLIEIYLEK